jgi:hypothetical protein
VGYTLVPERIQLGVLDEVLRMYYKVTHHGPPADPPWACRQWSAMGLFPDLTWTCLRIRHKRLRPVPSWQLQELGRLVWRISHTTPDGPPWLADSGQHRWYTYLVYPQQ